MMVILLLLFLGSIQHSGSKPSTSNINMNNVKIKTKGSQHASAMTEQDTSGQCSIQCTTVQSQFSPARKTLNCDGRKHDLSHCRTANAVPSGDGPNGCTIVTCDGRKVDLSQNNPVSNGQTNGDGQTCIQVQSDIAVWYRNGVCHRCRGNQHLRNNQVFCDGTEVDQNGRPIDQNQNNPVWTGNDIRGQTIRGQDINQVQTGAGGKQCINGVCNTCRGIQINGKCHDRDANGLNFGDGNKQCFNGVCHTIDNQLNGKTVDQNQNNPVWTGNDIRGQTILGQDINQDQTNGFNSNTVRQGDHDHDHDHDLLGPGGKDYDNYDIKDWINWANTIKQLQLFEEKGGKPSAGGEKGGEP